METASTSARMEDGRIAAEDGAAVSRKVKRGTTTRPNDSNDSA